MLIENCLETRQLSKLGAALKAVSQLVADTHSSFSCSLVTLMDRSTCACIYFMISFLISPRYLEKFNNIKCDAKQCLTVPMSRCPTVHWAADRALARDMRICNFICTCWQTHSQCVCGLACVCVWVFACLGFRLAKFVYTFCVHWAAHS